MLGPVKAVSPRRAGVVLAAALLLAGGSFAVAAPWSGAGAESLNVSIIGTYPVDSSTGIWSCAAYVHANGREFALLGADSLHVIDLREPWNPRRASSIPPATPLETGPYYVDIAVRGRYAYAAGRKGPVQIVDLGNPFLPVVRGSIPRDRFCACGCGFPCEDPDDATIETLFIDERGILYVSGIACGEGFHMFDLTADPTDPVWLCHAHTRPGEGDSFYTHTIHARDGVIFSSCSRYGTEGSPRWDILDGEDPCPAGPGPCGDGTKPRLIASFTHDGPDLHAHSSWRLDDPRYLITCDEKRDGHIRVWNVENLEEPYQIGEHHPDRTCHSVHEAVVLGETGYAAWYNHGIEVFSVENPAHPMRVGYYAHPTRWSARPGDRCCDPTDGPGANCRGVPMIDPFFPSGIFVAFEVDGGLLVGRFAYGPIGVPPPVPGAPPPPDGRGLRVVPLPGGREHRVLWSPPGGRAGQTTAPALEIFDAAGVRIARVAPARRAAEDAVEYRWSGRDDLGRGVPAGVYFLRLTGRPGKFGETAKLLVLE